MPNACVVPPLPHRVRQESASTTTETFKAGTYAKITERGSGQYQRFVSGPSGADAPAIKTKLIDIPPGSGVTMRPNILLLPRG